MDYALNATSCSVSFHGKTVVEDLSFQVRRGQVFGILGPNGAGKTTTLRLISCLIEPSSGDVEIFGMSTQVHKDHIRKRIGVVTEFPGLYDRLSVLDNLNFFSSFYNLPKLVREKNISYYLTLFDLWDKRDEPVGRLSKGMKQKVAIIRALVHEPDLLLMDEVTANLDAESIKKLKGLIRELKEQEKTIIFCSHTLSEVDELCDEFMIMNRQRITVTTPQKFKEDYTEFNVIMEVADKIEFATEVLQSSDHIQKFSVSGNTLHFHALSPDESNPALIRELTRLGIPIVYIQRNQISLEDSYLALLKKQEEVSA